MTRNRLIETYFGFFGIVLFLGAGLIYLVFQFLDWFLFEILPK